MPVFRFLNSDSQFVRHILCGLFSPHNSLETPIAHPLERGMGNFHVIRNSIFKFSERCAVLCYMVKNIGLKILICYIININTYMHRMKGVEMCAFWCLLWIIWRKGKLDPKKCAYLIAVINSVSQPSLLGNPVPAGIGDSVLVRVMEQMVLTYPSSDT